MGEGPYSEINPHIAGDVVISVETAQKEARAADLSLSSVLDGLLVHGILHLFGYDHERSETEAWRMQEKEQEILEILGAQYTDAQVSKSPKEVH
jgi:probable rRNA maturation factor